MSTAIASVRLADLKPLLARHYFAHVNVALASKPGVGKTMTIEAFAQEMEQRVAKLPDAPEFVYRMFYAPSMSPMDIVASAPDYDRGTLRNFHNELLPNAHVNPKLHGIVFFDEALNTDPATLKLLQKYCNGEEMGGLRKPKNVMVVIASNRLEDKAGVQQQSRAFLRRFEHIDVYATADDNLAYMAAQNWHPTVQTYLKDHVHHIDNYETVFGLTDEAQAANPSGKPNATNKAKMGEEGKRGVWANMSSWERVSKLEYAAEQMGMTLTTAEIVGNLGSGVGISYNSHREYAKSLIQFDDIIADPEGIAVPDKMDAQFMVAMNCAFRAKTEHIEPVYKFGRRLPLDLQAVLLKHLGARKDVKLASSPLYAQWLTTPQLMNILNGK